MRADGPRSRGAAGFTLLEVLAAVAVMALVYSMLATAAIQGLRAEGDAGRRLRASLIADQRLTEIEAQIAVGQTPDVGTSETEDGDFIVRMDVEPLDLQIGDTKASKRSRDRLERAVGARKDTKEEAGSLLRRGGPNQPPMLRRVDLTVAWPEGGGEQQVRRTTYGIDAVAAAPLIEQLVAAAAAEQAQAEQEQAQGAAGVRPSGATTGSATPTTGAPAPSTSVPIPGAGGPQ
jgi:prepilin-type N-terminal cleavage/methylation domain-containing protein